MLLLPITMAVMGVSLLTTVVPLMYDHFKDIPQFEYLIQGGVMTMPAIWVVLFSPIAGLLADRYGRRSILMSAMIVYAGIGIAPALLENLYAIIVTRVGVGICESVVMTVSTTLICDYFSGKARERWLAGQTATASLSALAIIPLGGVLAARYGWHGPFFIYIYSLLLVAGVAIFIWEPAPEPKPIATALQAPATVPFPWLRILSLCALTVVAAVMFYSIITQNGNALTVLGVTDPREQGLLTMIGGLGVPIGTFLYWAASRLPIGWLVFLDFLLVGIGFWGMGHALTPVAYVQAAFVNQIGCGLVLPTMLVWTTRGLAYEIRGRGNGMWQASFAIGQFASGMLLTLLGKQLGGLLAAFTALSVVCIVVAACAIVGALLARNSPRAQAPA
jgi:MFS family permease